MLTCFKQALNWRRRNALEFPLKTWYSELTEGGYTRLDMEKEVSAMRTKKLLAAGLACAALAAMLVVTVSAHGCHGGRRSGHHGGGYAQNSASVQASVTVCPVDGCTAVGRHWHDGTLYCGYGHANGYCDGACRALCPFDDCETAGRHWHDNTLYCGYGHTNGYCDGACRALCPLEDCDIAGVHVHGNASYCGYGHANGYCDGNCYALCPVEGCETTGRHWHDNTLYCGFDHTSGFCGGSCHVRFS